MRIGIVRGHVVLSKCAESLCGTRLLVVEPMGGKPLIVADRLNPGEGQMIGFVEGREAANPYWPGEAPVDAYCSLIVNTTDIDNNADG